MNDDKQVAMRAAFDAWHAQRATDLGKQIAATAAGWIASGDQDSPATYRAAMFHVLATADETGWLVWQAATEQAMAAQPVPPATTTNCLGLEKAARDAATSLETICIIFGSKRE